MIGCVSVRRSQAWAEPHADTGSPTFASASVSADGTSFLLTDAPLFVMKAKVLPGTTFVVGVDTAARPRVSSARANPLTRQ